MCYLFVNPPPQTNPQPDILTNPVFALFGQLCKNKLCYIILYFCKHSYLNPRTCLSVSVKKTLCSVLKSHFVLQKKKSEKNYLSLKIKKQRFSCGSGVLFHLTFVEIITGCNAVKRDVKHSWCQNYVASNEPLKQNVAKKQR